MKRTVTRGALVGLSLALALTGCSSGTATSDATASKSDGAAAASPAPEPPSPSAADATGEPLLIGAAVAKSGFLAPFDTPALATLQMSVDTVNAAGGIDGRPVSLQVIDTKSDREVAASAARDLVDAGADFIVTTCDFDFGAPTALVAQENDILSMAPCSSDVKFGPRGIGPLAFSAGTPNITEGAVMAKFAYEDQGWKTAYVLTDNSVTYTKGMCPAFASRFTELGGAVVGEDVFQNGDQSVASQVSRISSLPQQPDVVVVCSYPPGGVTAVVELRRKGITSPILSGFGMDGSYWLEAQPDLSDMYVAALASNYGDDPNPAVNELGKAYADAVGQPAPTSAFITGAVVLELFKKAVEETHSTSGATLSDALQRFQEVPTLAGPTTFTPEYHMSLDRPMAIIKIDNGTPKFLTTVVPENVAALDRQ